MTYLVCRHLANKLSESGHSESQRVFLEARSEVTDHQGFPGF